MAVVGKRKQRNPDSVPHLPRLDLVLSLATAGLFATNLALFSLNGESVALLELAAALTATAGAIVVCKTGFVPLGRLLSTKASLSKPRNLRKFCDQGWQLVVHVVMTWQEVQLLNANGWRWWTDTQSLWASPWQERGEPCPPELRRLFVAQMGIWFVTAFSHRFIEARHKDYFVMFGHHVATLGLLTLSYFNGWTPVGLVTLFIHDSSDIVIDLLKMVNYLGLDGNSGTFLAELFFVVNLCSFAAMRLWLFPTRVILSTLHYPHEVPLLHFGNLCLLLLIVLQAMHWWWFFLFTRILVRLLRGNQGHEAGRAEYEGSSDSEAEQKAQ